MQNNSEMKNFNASTSTSTSNNAQKSIEKKIYFFKLFNYFFIKLNIKRTCACLNAWRALGKYNEIRQFAKRFFIAYWNGLH